MDKTEFIVFNLIKYYRKIGTEVALIKNNVLYTGNDLALEIFEGTEVGNELVFNIIELAADLVRRKEYEKTNNN